MEHVWIVLDHHNDQYMATFASEKLARDSLELSYLSHKEPVKFEMADATLTLVIGPDGRKYMIKMAIVRTQPEHL